MPITPAFPPWFLFLDDMNPRSSTCFHGDVCRKLSSRCHAALAHILAIWSFSSFPVYTCFHCSFFDRRTCVSAKNVSGRLVIWIFVGLLSSQRSPSGSLALRIWNLAVPIPSSEGTTSFASLWSHWSLYVCCETLSAYFLVCRITSIYFNGIGKVSLSAASCFHPFFGGGK